MAQPSRTLFHRQWLTLGMPFLISAVVLFTCLLVRAHEGSPVKPPDAFSATPPPVALSKPIPSAPAAHGQARQKVRSPPVQNRAPVCSGVFAKIVSHSEVPNLSIASLSHNGERACLAHEGSHFGDYQVVAIGYDRGRMSPNVYLSGKEGLCQAMTFEKPPIKSESRATSSRRPGHTKGSERTEILVERSAVDAILERAFELTRGIRIVPQLKDGTVAGMQLFGIRQDSLLGALGLENGDSVVRVNGRSLNTPEAALSFYANIRSYERFDIEVNRAGRAAHVEIRVN